MNIFGLLLVATLPLLLRPAPPPMPVVEGSIPFVQAVESAYQGMTLEERGYINSAVTHIGDTCPPSAIPWVRAVQLCDRGMPFKPWDPGLLAALLTHEAVHVHDHWACRTYSGLEAEERAIRRMITVLERRGAGYSGWVRWYREQIGVHGTGYPVQRMFGCEGRTP